MQIDPSTAAQQLTDLSSQRKPDPQLLNKLGAQASTEEPLREAFQQFVGNTLFGQMLSAMRETLDKPAYFHGGQGEEIFQQQLDQVLVERITEASADTIADPMYELFMGGRS